jgi:hypothetical protein
MSTLFNRACRLILDNKYAVVAQLVEHRFRKAGVTGSNPVDGSIVVYVSLSSPPIKTGGYSTAVVCQLPKLEMRVRLSLPAPSNSII